jgi:branched-chain amino acid transport system ATP-binding protein
VLDCNGARRTTIPRGLVGLTPPRSGQVTLFNQNITWQPPYRIAAADVGYVPEGRQVFANLTTDENLWALMERP